MSYYIDIIDTANNNNVLVFEYARKSGIVLKWHGSDTKDEMAIVGSELQFQFGHNEKVDAKFLNLFTGNETRFKVIVKKASNNVILWQGHVLPDLYSEPYTNGVTFTEFTATDGMGRLKGKYLPNDFYSKEKSLIQIYAEVLKLTGLTIDFVFNPAIENVVNKDWNTIYVDTADFIKKDKKQDAYKIFETLLKDTLCICYQADNVWHIEGINQRNLRKFTAKKYTINGVLVGNYNGQRLLKRITPLVEPLITIIPPYNQIIVNHERVPQNFPKSASKESVDGISLQTGVVPTILASKWMSNGIASAYAKHKDYNVAIYHKNYPMGNIVENVPFNPNAFIDLKTKIFFYQNQKIEITLKFKLLLSLNTPAASTFADNMVYYELLFNDAVLFSNFGAPLKPLQNVVFENSTSSKELSLSYIVESDGLLNLKIYQPFGTIVSFGIDGVAIEKAEIEVLEFNELQTVTDLINDDFTVDKEVDLTYADDQSGFSKAFRLYRLKDDNTNSYNEILCTVAYQFVFDSKFYAVVSVQTAILIKENLFNVSYLNPLTGQYVYLPITRVVLNFNRGEQMVIETPFVIPSVPGAILNIRVLKYRILDVPGLRDNWVQWTDAVYKIENKPYVKTIANIYRRMFSLAHEKIELTCLDAVKFNDFVWFKYVINKNLQIINCTWNLDDNKSNIVLARTSYRDSGTNPDVENIPPIALTESPLFLTNSQTSINAIATAYDPDGFITSQLWTKILGAANDVISTPSNLNTSFSNLIGNYYQYKITATDNEGATGFALLDIYRKINYLMVTTEVYEYYEMDAQYQVNFAEGSTELYITGLLQPADILQFTARAVFNADDQVGGIIGNNFSYRVYKNNVLIEQNQPTIANIVGLNYVINFAFSYVNGDVIKIYLTKNNGENYGENLYGTLFIDEINFTAGYGVVTNLPYQYLLFKMETIV